MSDSKFRKILISFCQYLFVICMILNMRSIWTSSIDLTNLNRIIKVIMGFSIIVAILLKKKFNRRLCVKVFSISLFFTIYFILFYIVDPYKKIGIITNLVQLVLILIYSQLIEESFDQTFCKYSNIVYVIAIASLFFWVFGSLLKIIKPTGILYSTWTGYENKLRLCNNFFNLYYETQTSSLLLTDIKIVRNTAIFTEAPMSSFIFSLAFLYEFMIKEKTNVKKCLILLLAILSTISTTGISVVILSVSFKYFIANKNKTQLILTFIVAPIIFSIGFILLENALSSKLSSTSGLTRIDDFNAGFQAWINSPLFGNGYGNMDSINKYKSNFRGESQGFSNSPMRILAFGGIYLFAPYLYAAIKGFTALFRKKEWNRLGFYILFIFMFTITIVEFQMLTFYLFISLASEDNKHKRFSVKSINLNKIPISF